ncbi:MAG: toprim domain-containing protein [Parabacteroides sp.]|nr:toprim domain-containing protein [Parabacteroides sp.]
MNDYQHIRCFFDNDTAGVRAVKELLGRYGNRVQDKSGIYGGYKDLNEYWCKYGAKNG